MDLGEKLGIAGLALAVVAIFLPYVFKTMPWYITYSGISIGVGILCFAMLVWFQPPDNSDPSPPPSSIQTQPSALPPVDGLTSEERQFRAMREQRSALEIAVKDAVGTAIKYEFDKTGMGKIEIPSLAKTYRIDISKSGHVSVWIYARADSPFTKLAIVRAADTTTGKVIDFRTLRSLRDVGNLTIGDRAFFETNDGRIIQLVLTGVLYYDAGDTADEVRFKYKVFDAGEFLIASL
jgi:hypothetical protein